MVVKDTKENKSVYGSGPDSQTIERHVLSVLVDNEPGVLARVIGLFSGRGYNIESLTVAEVSQKLNQSRMTIVAVGTLSVIDQIRHQLGRLVPVHKVTDLTEEGENIELDLALIKVVGTAEQLSSAKEIADKFKANTIEDTGESFIFQIIDNPNKVTEFIETVAPLGLVNISRTGSAAISCGPERF